MPDRAAADTPVSDCERADTTTRAGGKTIGGADRRWIGGSRELLTLALVAAVLLASMTAAAVCPPAVRVWLLPAAAATSLATIAVLLRLLVFRPITALVSRSRTRLGPRFQSIDPRYRDEMQELSFLVSTMISIFSAAEDKEWVAEGVKEDLLRATTLNRRLLDAAELGREMSVTLPYRETVERVLSSVRSFLAADLVALLSTQEDDDHFTLEGVHGAVASAMSTRCCTSVPDCPVREAVTSGTILHATGHRCAFLPDGPPHLIVLPVRARDMGQNALIVGVTDDEVSPTLLADDILVMIQAHAHNALVSAHKYDAIRRQVVTDHLTGLYNRRFFTTRANEEVERALRHGLPLSMLMIDVDRFKTFNDTYGHATGDRVLQTVGKTIQTCLRTSDVCARYGGEEFAVLLPNTGGENGFVVGERIRRTLAHTRHTGLGLPADASITVSIGIATCPDDAGSLDGVLGLADQALYEAKRGGRDRVVAHGGQQRWASL